MKKILSVVFTAVLLLSLSACRKSGVFETSSDHPVVPGDLPNALTDNIETSVSEPLSAPETITDDKASGDSEVVIAEKKEESVPSASSTFSITSSVTDAPVDALTPPSADENGTKQRETTLSLIRDGFLKLVNEERARVGVGPLSYDDALQSAANVRAGEIIQLFEHTRPDGSSCFTAVDMGNFKGTAMGENIGQVFNSRIGSGSSDSTLNLTDDRINTLCSVMFEQFKNSPDHYANMINAEFSMTGIGVDYRITAGTDIPEFYFAHMFGG